MSDCLVVKMGHLVVILNGLVVKIIVLVVIVKYGHERVSASPKAVIKVLKFKKRKKLPNLYLRQQLLLQFASFF